MEPVQAGAARPIRESQRRAGLNREKRWSSCLWRVKKKEPLLLLTTEDTMTTKDKIA